MYLPFRMISSTYLYIILSAAVCLVLLFLFYNFKNYKSEIDNKILLRNLLEGLDLELPEELKGLDNSSTDTQKLS